MLLNTWSLNYAASLAPVLCGTSNAFNFSALEMHAVLQLRRLASSYSGGGLSSAIFNPEDENSAHESSRCRNLEQHCLWNFSFEIYC